MGIVLDFIFEGKVMLSEINIKSLLDLLETSRLMCLDSLTQGVMDYLQDQIKRKFEVEFNDCPFAFDFTNLKSLRNFLNVLFTTYIRTLIISHLFQGLKS